MTSSLDRPIITREHLTAIDDKLSKRHIPLDPAGYFVIYVDREEGLICAKHYGVVVNDRGLAIDPDTGKPLSAKGTLSNPLLNTYTGRTAKELCIALFENPELTPPAVTYFDHAAYLGREFQKAEAALLAGTDYIQD